MPARMCSRAIRCASGASSAGGTTGCRIRRRAASPSMRGRPCSNSSPANSPSSWRGSRLFRTPRPARRRPCFCTGPSRWGPPQAAPLLRSSMSRSALLAFALAAGLSAARPVEPPLRVVTSSTDLYDIARQVGGTRIVVKHIGEGYQDPHFVEAKPSFILDLAKADVWAFVGLDLEIGWMPLLLDGARNPKIRMGGSGYLDVSRVIPVIDVPSGNVDRSQGDVHPLGNPHYWLDPENGRRIAKLFRDKFTELDPAGASSYGANEKAFETRLGDAERQWAPELARIKGKPVVAWHTSWRYFAEYTGMNIVGFMEPKPGVPPSPSPLAGLLLHF